MDVLVIYIRWRYIYHTLLSHETLLLDMPSFHAHVRITYNKPPLFLYSRVYFHTLDIKMDDSKLVKHIFNYYYGICQNELVCWYEREQMTILNKRQWYIDVNNKPKLRTYILFKSDLLLEDYVKYHMHRRHDLYLRNFG